jgi:hypothetical protein
MSQEEERRGQYPDIPPLLVPKFLLLMSHLHIG